MTDELDRQVTEESTPQEEKTNQPPVTSASPKAASSKSKRKPKGKKGKGKKKPSGQEVRARRSSLFPASSFEEALTIPNAIQKHAAGQKVRRIRLFDLIGKSPDSGPSRQWVTNANKYGLIKGSYTAEYLELTPDGFTASSNEVLLKDKALARFKLGIQGIAPFRTLFEAQKGNRLPATSILEDIAKENGISAENARECVETFIVNAKFIGVLRPIAGAERVISIDEALEYLPRGLVGEKVLVQSDGRLPAADAGAIPTQTPVNEHDEMDKVCFYISPIGNEDSEHRRHADLFLGSIVEPALEEFGLKVIRADKIGRPGMITAQIIEYILKAKLVVADLSFHNPNVFYELALRHICRLPTVQIIRTVDPIPFDLDQFRTVQIDTTDIYSLVPNLQTYKAEIATQVRTALLNADSVDNPVSTYYPDLKVAY